MARWDDGGFWDGTIRWDQPAEPPGPTIELHAQMRVLAPPKIAGHIATKGYVDDALAVLYSEVIAALRDEIAALRAEFAALKADITYPLTFVFGGTPVVNSMINVPLVHNLTVPANLAGSRYYNASNGLVASQFTLTRITAAGAQSTIGTIDVSTGGTATFSGAGSNALVAGDRLRMTAVTIGGSLANVGITIQVMRR